MTPKYKVVFLPEHRRVEVIAGTSVLRAVQLAGLSINAPCGGNGICGKCQVKILEGQIEGEKYSPDTCLACQTKILSDLVVEIATAPEALSAKILERGTQRSIEIRAPVRKIYLEIPPPSLTDQRADFERIQDSLPVGLDQKPTLAGELFPALPTILRESNYKITVTRNQHQIIGIEKGDTTDANFGIAVDIGTTTVAGLLVNLNSGEILGASARTNPQVQHGADVVSRIDFAETTGGLTQLQQEINACLNEIIGELVHKGGIQPENIYEVTLAGNTTMNHLFHGIPCGNIARAPYIPVFRGGMNLTAHHAHLKINSQGNVFTLPNIAGFVGADTTAAILASGMPESDEIQLLVDIGTNGEIALGNKDRIIVCSTAAGPAFEGARISCGMRGTTGAVEKVVINDDLELSIIGDQNPLGICGSGVIDVVAELLKIQAIDETGRLLSGEEIPFPLAPPIKRRIQAAENGNRFILTNADGQSPIFFSQRDIREVQLAKAAIRTGIEILLSEFSLTAEAITAVLLAGAFGNYIRPAQAQAIGLLPEIPLDRIKFIGNAAIEGALRVLLSVDERALLEDVARQIEYVELSARPDFQEEYMSAMFFKKVVA